MALQKIPHWCSCTVCFFSLFAVYLCKYFKKCLPDSVGRVYFWPLFLFIKAVTVWNMSLGFLVCSPFSHGIITDKQTANTGGGVYKLLLQCVCVCIPLPRLAQRWSSLSKALYRCMLGWSLCNF